MCVNIVIVCKLTSTYDTIHQLNCLANKLNRILTMNSSFAPIKHVGMTVSRFLFGMFLPVLFDRRCSLFTRWTVSAFENTSILFFISIKKNYFFLRHFLTWFEESPFANLPCEQLSTCHQTYNTK